MPIPVLPAHSPRTTARRGLLATGCLAAVLVGAVGPGSATAATPPPPQAAGAQDTAALSADTSTPAAAFDRGAALAEVRQLRARERWPKRRHTSARYDGHVGVLTLEDLLDLREAESAAGADDPEPVTERTEPLGDVLEAVGAEDHIDRRIL